MLAAFHFLRPWWFLALIPAIVAFIVVLRLVKSSDNVWSKHCDPHLLEYLLYKNKQVSAAVLPYLLLAAWIVAIFALAGPTWSRYAQNVYQKNIARVIALDVSQSMNSTDISPSRLERGKYKVLDLLHGIKEGQTGMIVFSSQAFVVSPLTLDSNTIASMVPVIDSSIVPVQGSDIGKALAKSADLIKQAGFTQGEIILVTDSTPSDQDLDQAKQLGSEGFDVSVLGIGTKEGGPITNPDGSLVTDSSGNAVLAGLNSAALEKLAIDGNGEYVPFSNGNSDVKTLLGEGKNKLEQASKTVETKSLWKDQGHWLIWLLVVLAAFIARRGWLEKLC